MYRVIWVVGFLATEGESVIRIAVQANTGQSPNAVSGVLPLSPTADPMLE